MHHKRPACERTTVGVNRYDGEQASLRDLHHALPQEVCNETIPPQEEVLLKLEEHMTTATQKLRDTLSNTLSVVDPVKDLAETKEHKRGAEGDSNAEEVDKEQQTIRDNAALMEPVEDAEEYAADLKSDDIPIVVGEDQEESDPRDQDNEMKNRQGLQNANAIERLHEDLRRTRQAKHDLEMMMDALERVRTCVRRRFYEGQVRRQNELEMPWVFCDTFGQHYSDSCPPYTNEQERIRILHEKYKCQLYLDTYCTGGRSCQKRYTACYHWWKYRHNSAICELPGKN
ncbi:hypothetical protein Aduo_018292 [Ancylostoma duodenale]